MHLVIDARVIESSTGVYIARLLEHLHRRTRSWSRTTVLVPPSSLQAWQRRCPDFDFVKASQSAYSLSEQISLAGLLYSLRPSLVHFTMPQQPLLWLGPRVTTVHDTTLVHFDNVLEHEMKAAYAVRKWVFKRLLRNVVSRSDVVVVPTAFVREDLSRYCGSSHRGKMRVILEDGDPLGTPPQPISGLVGKRFLLFVGNAFPYKNVKRILLSFGELRQRHPDLHLALAGRRDRFYDALEADARVQGLSRVHFLGFITDAEKRWAFQHAEAFVTASLSEGFHIPLLEAMHEGCPVVASDRSCIPEVAGEAALYFNPYSTESLVEAVEQLLANPRRRHELESLGRTRVGMFSWERMAQETAELYESILRRRA